MWVSGLRIFQLLGGLDKISEAFGLTETALFGSVLVLFLKTCEG